MENTINRVPSGLLSLLDTQTQGQNPNLLNSTVQGNFPLENYYCINKGLETVFLEGANMVAVGISADPVIIPEGELWAIYNITGILESAEAIGATVRFSVGLQLSSIDAFVVVHSGYANGMNFVTGSFGKIGCTFSTPLLMRSPTRFALSIDYAVAAPVAAGYTPSIAVTIARLKI